MPSSARPAGGRMVVALAGNPNCGKTSVFNAITGANQHVGNYPGVTVEKKTGRARVGGVEMELVDLPGTYSLSAYSPEEVVARQFIMEQRPDVVIDVVDASNLERNLYLTTQLLHLGVPIVLALNMMDVAEAHGLRIDLAKLAELVGVPVVATVGSKGAGIDALLAAAVASAGDKPAAVARQRVPNYGAELEEEIDRLAHLPALACQPNPRWLAIKLLEHDQPVVAELAKRLPAAELDAVVLAADHARKHLLHVFGDPAEIVLAERRYGFASGACAETVRQTLQPRRAASDVIDKIVTHRFLALPIFALVMFAVFQLTFLIGNPVKDLLDVWKDQLAQVVRDLPWAGGGAQLLKSLLADGIIEGVGAVLVFVPLVVLLFLALAFLEDTGYMARAAFVLDGIAHRMGLHGKSFIPMLLGFGCTVPAIMATRTLETRRDRLVTMLILPFMSCGARLPVYLLILGAFWPPTTLVRLGPVAVTNQAMGLMGLYALGVVLAVVAARVLRKTVFRGETTPFVMELPPYRLPTLRGLLLHIWQPTWQYARKAGTIILALVVLMWAGKTWPQLPPDQQAQFTAQRQVLTAGGALMDDARQARATQIDLAEHRAGLEHSTIGRIGQAIEPALAPCGFDWKIDTALIGAFAAKEVFVGQMAVIYAVGDHEPAGQATLRGKIAADYTPLQGLCLLLFILIASPCAATVAVTLRESGHWKWAALQWGYLTGLAWVVAMVVFQIGRHI